MMPAACVAARARAIWRNSSMMRRSGRRPSRWRRRARLSPSRRSMTRAARHPLRRRQHRCRLAAFVGAAEVELLGRPQRTAARQELGAEAAGGARLAVGVLGGEAQLRRELVALRAQPLDGGTQADELAL